MILPASLIFYLLSMCTSCSLRLLSVPFHPFSTSFQFFLFSYRDRRDGIVVRFTVCLYNQCRSPLKLWVQIPLMARCIHYAIKFVSDLQQVGGFFPGAPVSATNKTDRHDITEIVLKVTLSTINPTPLKRVNTWLKPHL